MSEIKDAHGGSEIEKQIEQAGFKYYSDNGTWEWWVKQLENYKITAIRHRTMPADNYNIELSDDDNTINAAYAVSGTWLLNCLTVLQQP